MTEHDDARGWAGLHAAADTAAARDTLPPFEERAAIPGTYVYNEQAPGYVKETSDDAIRQLQSHCHVMRNEAKRAGRLVAAGIWETLRCSLADLNKP